MTLDFSRCRLPPFPHQREDVEALVTHGYYFITSEMRTGKTKICIDAAQFMFEADTIERVIVVAPSPVRDVWYDRQFGELAKHLWLDLSASVSEFHARSRSWQHGPVADRHLEWIITNYEFIRSTQRLAQLLPHCNAKTLLVLDESSYVKNHASAQTEACMELRKRCGRVVLLNGTPIFHSPLDLFSQGNLLHPSILQCKYVTHYKARYAIQAAVMTRSGKPLLTPRGRPVEQVEGWHKEGLADLARRFAPCTVRRLQSELNLPPKLDPVVLTATLTPETWRAYKDMRDELVIWLQSDVATAATAAVKALRLAQITSGFVGGVEDAAIGEEPLEDGLLDSLQMGEDDGRRSGRAGREEGLSIPRSDLDADPRGAEEDQRALDGDQGAGERSRGEHVQAAEEVATSPLLHFKDTDAVREIGREKLDVLLWFLGQHLEADEKFKVLAWTRFRPELFRMMAEVENKYPQFETAMICGGQSKADRRRAFALLHPDTSPDHAVFVGGVEGTGSFGIDCTAAHTSVDMSSGYSPGRYAQKSDRIFGPRQVHPVAYFDVVAVGPKGQKTIDHAVLAARRNGEDVAEWTASRWVKAITEE